MNDTAKLFHDRELGQVEPRDFLDHMTPAGLNFWAYFIGIGVCFALCLFN